VLNSIEQVIDKLDRNKKILFSTHRHCDGDGLGAILGLYHSLKPAGYDVTVMTIDGIPKKYSFLNGEEYTLTYEELKQPIDNYDLCLIFDTNDHRLVDPLFTDLKNKGCEVLFVDHHPLLSSGPLPTEGSFVDTSAASTGEISYKIIKALGLKINPLTAEAIYTSICFDTQLFRYIKGAATSHLICAELLDHLDHPEKVHQYLFSTYTVGKTKFLSEILGSIELYDKDQVAFLLVTLDQLKKYGMEPDESRDVIDMVMNINSLEAAVLFREESKDTYKISLRSKGNFKVLHVAEKFSGGGHPFAAGALLIGPLDFLKQQILDLLSEETHKK
jgi:phosphoesterase RecJ-like protein